MVWPFSRRKIVDLTEKSFGVVRAQPKTKVSSGSDGYADLTSGTDLFSAIGNTSSVSQSDNLEIKDMKNKIEDVEYKLENLRKKINDLLDRFEVVEKKLRRNYGQG